MSTEDLIDLPTGRYTHSVMLVNSLGSEVYPSIPPEFEIAQTGLYRGRVANLGYSIARRSAGWTSTSVMGDVSNYLDTSQANNTPVVVGTEYFIRSSSVEDSVGGTGIRKMRINYLNATGHRTIANINLNGTTAVSLGNAISFVQYMESAEEGSAECAVGNITIASVSGAPTVAQTIEKIVVGDARSMSGRVRVPTGFTLYLLGWTASAISATMDARIKGTVFTDDRALSTGFHFQQTAYLASGQNFIDENHYLKFPAGAEIKISAIPGSAPAGNRCDGSFHFLLISNT